MAPDSACRDCFLCRLWLPGSPAVLGCRHPIKTTPQKGCRGAEAFGILPDVVEGRVGELPASRYSGAQPPCRAWCCPPAPAVFEGHQDP